MASDKLGSLVCRMFRVAYWTQSPNIWHWGHWCLKPNIEPPIKYWTPNTLFVPTLPGLAVLGTWKDMKIYVLKITYESKCLSAGSVSLEHSHRGGITQFWWLSLKKSQKSFSRSSEQWHLKIFGYFAFKRLNFNPRGFSPHFVGSLISSSTILSAALCFPGLKSDTFSSRDESKIAVVCVLDNKLECFFADIPWSCADWHCPVIFYSKLVRTVGQNL